MEILKLAQNECRIYYLTLQTFINDALENFNENQVLEFKKRNFKLILRLNWF